MSYVPKRVFFTKGVGRHKEKLTSFEMALRDAGIAEYNLVRVSSILPPGCKIIKPERGLEALLPGQIVHCVMSENKTNEPGRLISAAIGYAVPANDRYGYISEHHDFGRINKNIADYSEDLAASMLATTLGIEFDPNKDYDERKKVYKMSGQIVRSGSIVQTAKGPKNGNWLTVLAAAVFVPVDYPK